MRLFQKICDLYEKKDYDRLEKYKDYLVSHFKINIKKKKLMLIVFINFLLQSQNKSKAEIEKIYLSSLSHIDTKVHIGQKIYDKLVEIKDKKIMDEISKSDKQ